MSCIIRMLERFYRSLLKHSSVRGEEMTSHYEWLLLLSRYIFYCADQENDSTQTCMIRCVSQWGSSDHHWGTSWICRLCTCYLSNITTCVKSFGSLSSPLLRSEFSRSPAYKIYSACRVRAFKLAEYENILIIRYLETALPLKPQFKTIYANLWFIQ